MQLSDYEYQVFEKPHQGSDQRREGLTAEAAGDLERSEWKEMLSVDMGAQEIHIKDFFWCISVLPYERM